MEYGSIIKKAKAAARAAGESALNEWYGGEDRGACGFAWVTVYPAHKGNTRLGREERKALRGMGLEPDWTGKTFQLWNPSGLHCQNIDALAAGARAAAAVLNAHGFKASAGSRLD